MLMLAGCLSLIALSAYTIGLQESGKSIFEADHIMGKIYNNMPTPQLVFEENFGMKEINKELDPFFEHFKATYEKKYSNRKEEVERRKLWESVVKRIVAQNIDFRRGESKFVLGVNALTDMTMEEIRKQKFGYRGMDSLKKKKIFRKFKKHLTKKSPVDIIRKSDQSLASSLPGHVDYRASPCTTPVKDQGSCGSCWAFSSVENIETVYCLWDIEKIGKSTTLKDITMSPENVIDCSYYLGNAGCDGGYMPLAFLYVMLQRGIDSEASYPYGSAWNFAVKPCEYNPKNKIGIDLGYYWVTPYSAASLKYHVATVGPITVAVDADVDAFLYYEGGIVDTTSCSNSTSSLDHGVVVYGYGVENGVSYWLIRNSWGHAWGDRGYLKIAIDGNICGVLDEPSYPATPGLVHSLGTTLGAVNVDYT